MTEESANVIHRCGGCGMEFGKGEFAEAAKNISLYPEDCQ